MGSQSSTNTSVFDQIERAFQAEKAELKQREDAVTKRENALETLAERARHEVGKEKAKHQELQLETTEYKKARDMAKKAYEEEKSHADDLVSENDEKDHEIQEKMQELEKLESVINDREAKIRALDAGIREGERKILEGDLRGTEAERSRLSSYLQEGAKKLRELDDACQAKKEQIKNL